MPNPPDFENNCQTEGIFSPVAGTMGSLQANEVLKGIVNPKPEVQKAEDAPVQEDASEYGDTLNQQLVPDCDPELRHFAGVRAAELSGLREKEEEEYKLSQLISTYRHFLK